MVRAIKLSFPKGKIRQNQDILGVFSILLREWSRTDRGLAVTLNENHRIKPI